MSTALWCHDRAVAHLRRAHIKLNCSHCNANEPSTFFYPLSLQTIATLTTHGAQIPSATSKYINLLILLCRFYASPCHSAYGNGHNLQISNKISILLLGHYANEMIKCTQIKCTVIPQIFKQFMASHSIQIVHFFFIV